MAKPTIKWTGLDGLRGKLDGAPGEVKFETAKVMFQSALNPIMLESQRVVPVDVGNLANSAFVDAPKIRASSVEVVMGYGGAAKAYALAVHEWPDGDAKFPRSWRVAGEVNFSQGGPKYLERPFNKHAATVEDRIMKVLRRAFR